MFKNVRKQGLNLAKKRKKSKNGLSGTLPSQSGDGNHSRDILIVVFNFAGKKRETNMNKQRVVCVDNATCFFGLLEECGPGGFYNNRRSLLDAYVDHRLYTVVEGKSDVCTLQWYGLV